MKINQIPVFRPINVQYCPTSFQDEQDYACVLLSKKKMGKDPNVSIVTLRGER